MSDTKLDDWIKPYGIDKHGEPPKEQSDIVAYCIPSYKIERLVQATNDADELVAYKALGNIDSIKKGLNVSFDSMMEDKKTKSTMARQIVLLEKSIEEAIPAMLPKMRESFEPIIIASKAVRGIKPKEAL